MQQAFAKLLEECEVDPALVAKVREQARELVQQANSDEQFRWDLLELRYLMLHPPNDDSVRERYGELLDIHRNAPARVAALRKLGDHIRFLEDSGALPAAMVARTPRNK